MPRRAFGPHSRGWPASVPASGLLQAAPILAERPLRCLLRGLLIRREGFLAGHIALPGTRCMKSLRRPSVSIVCSTSRPPASALPAFCAFLAARPLRRVHVPVRGPGQAPDALTFLANLALCSALGTLKTALGSRLSTLSLMFRVERIAGLLALRFRRF